MAKFLFLQDVLFDYFGPMYLSAVLKASGHYSQIVCLSEEKNLSAKVRRFKPDAILFSSMTGPHKKYLALARELKTWFSGPVLMGGPHPTFFPEVLASPEIDFICRGEGEDFIVDFAKAVRAKRGWRRVKNLGYKKGKKLVFNPLRNLIKDLDSLPFPDRELYYRSYPELSRSLTKRFLATRGCPYNCSFCFNHSLRKLYRDKGSYLRRRSAQNIVEEILKVRAKYPLKTVRFPDDSFTLNKKWLLGLLKLYRQEVGLPFTCLVRANEIDESVVSALKEANCANVFFGIESGDEKMRNQVLGKGLTNKAIIKSAWLLKKYKILFGTYNMIGLPGENLEDVIKSARFNHRVGSVLPTSTILQPYPGTEIAEYSKKQGYLEKDFNVDNFDVMTAGSVLKMANKRQVVNFNSFFFLAARMPFLMPLIRVLIKLPPNPVFKLFSFFSMGWVRLKAHRLSPLDGLRLARRFMGKI